MANDGTRPQLAWDDIGGEYVRFVNANLPAGQPPLTLETTSTDENPEFIKWLSCRKSDAFDTWFRLNVVAHDDKYSPERFKALKDKLRLRYARYFPTDITGISDDFREDIDTDIDFGEALPWDDSENASLDLAILQLKSQTDHKKCLTCRQTLPFNTEAPVATALKRCGVCAADIDRAELNRYSVVQKKTLDCKQCGSRICAMCGGPDTDFECSKCDRIIGLKPQEIAGDPTYRCWGCFSEQTAAKLDAQSMSMPFCSCRSCSRKLCLRCAKPLPDKPVPPPKPRPLHKLLANMEAGDPTKAYPGYSMTPEPLKGIRYAPLDFDSFRKNNLFGSPLVGSQNTPGSALLIPTTTVAAVPNVPEPSRSQEPNTNAISAQDRVPAEPVRDNELARGGLQKYVDRLTDTLFPTKNYPGSEPWKRRAHRRGYVDKKLTDLHRAPKVAQVDFGKEVCPQVGYEDTWYTISNSELYDQAVTLVQDCFCTHDFPMSYKGSVWLDDLGPQFIRYADMVAHGDILVGGYEKILRSRTQRKFLLVGILAQIIVRKIYSELLFGATPAQKQELERLDRHFIDGDGYKRTAARANFINLLLEYKVLPDDFWPAVDSLAASTTAVFLPLLNILNYFNPHSQDGVDLLKVFDGIHKLIAHAAFYSIAMRRSSNSIFFVTSAYPGARRDLETEREASPELHQKSAARAKLDAQAWNAERQARQHLWRDVPDAAVAAALHMRLDMAAHYRRRGAKVKFAVWPRIVRYRPENVGQPVRRMRAERLGVRPKFPEGFAERHGFVEAGSQEELESGEGQRVVGIGRAMVVYYQGFINPRPQPQDDRAAAGGPIDTDTKMIEDCCGGSGPVVVAEIPSVDAICADLEDEVLDDGPRLLTYVDQQEQLVGKRRNLHWRWLRLAAGLALGVCALLYHRHALALLHEGVELMPVLWSRVLELARELDALMWLVTILLTLAFAFTRRLLVGVAAVAAVSWIMLFVKDGALRLPALFAAITSELASLAIVVFSDRKIQEVDERQLVDGLFSAQNP